MSRSRSRSAASPVLDDPWVDTLRLRNEQLGLGVDDLRECVAAAHSATQQTADITTRATDETDLVADAAASVSAATEQLEASMREVASTSATSRTVAEEAGSTVAEALETVGRLGASTGRIAEVIQSVTRITTQTRMLALNATIEAARAGDAGQGFAIVAQEVKDLASQTGAATDEITDRLAAVAADTTAMEHSVEAVAQVLEQLRSLQLTIAAAVEQQTAAIGELNRSATSSADSAAALREAVSTSASAAALARSALDRSQRWLQQVSGTVQEYRTDVDAHADGRPVHPLVAAIGAHAAWKGRLRSSVDEGRVPAGTSIEQSRRDDVCAFGRWLHGGEAEALDAGRAAAVLVQHREFHQRAADVLAAVAAGRSQDAAAQMSESGAYTAISRALTDALVDWAGTVGAA